jgi:phosphotransferase system HPr (HPr) family protein
MISAEVIIENKNGMDSKAAAMLIQKASNYTSEIWFDLDGKKANAKSLLGLLSLCVSKGTKVNLVIEGQDQDKALEELNEYIHTQWEKDSV